MLKGTIDFETDPFLHGRDIFPFASCIYFDDENNQVIWSDDCANKTFEYLLEFPKCELYAHNGGKFDFWYGLPYIEKQNVKIINGRIAKMQIGDVTLIDSLLLIPFALDKYKKTKIDYNLMEKDVRHLHRDKIINYLIDDCKYLLELLNRFHEVLGKKLTIGSAAIQSIKNNGIEFDRQNKAHDDIFRPYYNGGRVEAIKKGHFNFEKNKPAYMIDLNSAYSHAMTFDHPTGQKYKSSKKLPAGDSGAWFADIVAVSHGALPKKNDLDLEFPNDDVEKNFLVTGWEILAGLKTGTLSIKKINQVLIPKKTVNFTPFVKFHYNARQAAQMAGDKADDLIHKFAGNSGYGKFATNPEKFYDWLIDEKGIAVNKVYEGAENYKWYSDVGDKSLWRCPASEEQKAEGYFDVATAASITGFVRARMLHGLQSVSTPYYCDTDGIICDDPGDLVLSAKNLGEWKTEMRPRELYIVGKKIYAAKESEEIKKFVCKGARLSYEEIALLHSIGQVNWKNRFPTFSLKHGVFYVDRDIYRDKDSQRKKLKNKKKNVKIWAR